MVETEGEGEAEAGVEGDAGPSGSEGPWAGGAAAVDEGGDSDSSADDVLGGDVDGDASDGDADVQWEDAGVEADDTHPVFAFGTCVTATAAACTGMYVRLGVGTCLHMVPHSSP